MGLFKKSKGSKKEGAPPGQQQQNQDAEGPTGGSGPKEEFPTTGISEVPSEALYMKAIRRPSIIPKSKPRKITPYPTSPSSDHPYKPSPSQPSYKPRSPGQSAPNNNPNNYKK